MRRAGPDGLGRFAAWCAAWRTGPYHGRAFLAECEPRGYVAPTARLSHPDLRVGTHVYIGDNVIASSCPAGGPVELQDGVQLYGDTFLETGAGGRLSIGAGTHVQPGCHFHAHLTPIRIGRSVEVAAGCSFYSYNHGTAPGQYVMDQRIESKGGITVGDGCWIGHGATVLAGVTIGAGAVIGAGSVVTRDVPDNAIAAGNPARVLRFRT